MRRLFAVVALLAGFLLVPTRSDAALGNVAPWATATASYTSPGKASPRSTTASTRRARTTSGTAAGAPGRRRANSGPC